MDEATATLSKFEELQQKYLDTGLSAFEAEMLAKGMVAKEAEATRAKRLEALKPYNDVVDAAQADFDAVVTNSPEMSAFKEAKANLDALKNSEDVKPLRDALDEAVAKRKAFLDENPDLKGGRGRSTSGKPRAKGYTGRVAITHTESGEQAEFKNLFQAWKHVEPEADHGIGWNAAPKLFAKKGYTVEKLDG